MTADRDRALRRLKTAEESKAKLDAAKAGRALQAAWEDWAIDWRIAVEMAEAYGRRNRLISGNLTDLKAYREADHELGYVWQSGNAERHSPDGSSNSTNAVTLNPADPSQPLIIDHLVFERGRPVAQSIRNGVWNFDAGDVSLLPIKGRGKGALPPDGATPHSLAKSGAAYLDRLRTLIFPQ